MSTIITKNIQQAVVGGVTQPLKIGGIAADGSDADIIIESDGTLTTIVNKIIQKNNNAVAFYQSTKSFSIPNTTAVLKYQIGLGTYDGVIVEVYASGINQNINGFSVKKVWMVGRVSAAPSFNLAQDYYWTTGTNQSTVITMQAIGNDYVGVYFASQNAYSADYTVTVKITGSGITVDEL